MRARRAATCVTAARTAITEGRLVDAQERLDEALELDPDNAEVRLLLEELASVESLAGGEGAIRQTASDSGWAHYLAVVVAIVTLAALAFLWPSGPAKSPRLEPARQEPGAPPGRPGLADAGVPDRLQPEPQLPASPIPAQTPPELAEQSRSDSAGTVTAREAERPVAPESSGRRERDATTAKPLGTAGRDTSSVTRPAPVVESSPAVQPPSGAAVPATLSRPPLSQSGAGETTQPVETVSNMPASRPGPERIHTPPVVPERPEAVPTLAPATTEAAPAAPRGPDPSVDIEAVQQTLKRYVDAYGRLDARAARNVWPTVNHAALERAFGGLVSQGIVFDRCEVRVAGDEAAAHCNGTARYVRKVGSREPQTESRRWTFQLQRAGSGWHILSADTR